MPLGRVIPFPERSDLHPKGVDCCRTVVQIGRDPELLNLRAKLISSAGYTVHSTTPDEALEEVEKAPGCQVWVFCHTLEFFDLALLAAAIRRRWPGDKLLRLAGPNNASELPGLLDELLEPVGSVNDLLQVLAGLAHRPYPNPAQSR
jgi:hypothetical protein